MADTPTDLLAIGLGNPGPEYAGTRHNVGADAVALLARRLGMALKKSSGGMKAVAGDARVGAARLALAVPTTWMNESGQAVAPLAKRHGVDTEPHRLLIAHDELDLPLGVVRLKLGGGLAGHNGLKSIKAHLHTEDFARLRIGIGRPPGRQDPADFVLKRPGKAERLELDIALVEAADAIERVLCVGLDAAMGIVNQRGAAPAPSDG